MVANETTVLPSQDELIQVILAELRSKHQIDLRPETGVTLSVSVMYCEMWGLCRRTLLANEWPMNSERSLYHLSRSQFPSWVSVARGVVDLGNCALSVVIWWAAHGGSLSVKMQLQFSCSCVLNSHCSCIIILLLQDSYNRVLCTNSTPLLFLRILGWLWVMHYRHLMKTRQAGLTLPWKHLVEVSYLLAVQVNKAE